MRLVLGTHLLVACAVLAPSSARGDEAKPDLVAAAPATVERAPSGARRYAGAVVVGAIAAASAATGAGLVAGSAGEFRGLEERCAASPCAPTDVDQLSTQVHAGYALLAIGGAALAIDLVQIVVLSRSGPSGPRVSIAPTPGGLVALGSF